MEIDTNPNREPSQQPSESRLSEELSFDSWSDDSNDLNYSDEVQKRKFRQPRLYAMYEPGFTYLSGKKTKVSTSASSVTRPRDARRPRGGCHRIGKSTSIHAFLANRREVNLPVRCCVTRS
ncbi:hypothetical protein EVAR_54838_1 [Eumeta japonica]|uniref:Uncharacterized protein n=1 Tax=Eumeta variegata TaxID=151549 RepID=A0A4C1ZFM8_EUMVA|nr:hypothetical protein EVAR_54838_1 [Eumeta japonica]